MRASLFVLTFAWLAATAPGQGTTDPRFLRGKALFDHNFHRVDGVGAPEMNADSCRACHRDPAMGGAGGLELNVTRVAHIDTAGVSEVPEGQLLSKLRAPWFAAREEHGTATNLFEQRQTPSLFGAGLIATIPGSAITANEDPNDADGDGIRGVARRLDIGGTIEIGRYGWKAQVPRISDFVRDAGFGELGLTTADPNQRGFGARIDADSVADPELSDEQVGDLAFFIASLPAPQRRGSDDPAVLIGAQVFTEVGCAKCHIPSLPGSNGPVPLYSDLLLHNVMPTSFTGMIEPGAGAGFYRTPPLWGIADTAPYMHDGRAEDLAAAIDAHLGEATGVTAQYRLRPKADRDALLTFLLDL